MNKRCQPDKNNQKRTTSDKSGNAGKACVRGRETFISCEKQGEKRQSKGNSKEINQDIKNNRGGRREDRLSSSNT
jgi:hypothetical protein